MGTGRAIWASQRHETRFLPFLGKLMRGRVSVMEIARMLLLPGLDKIADWSIRKALFRWPHEGSTTGGQNASTEISPTSLMSRGLLLAATILIPSFLSNIRSQSSTLRRDCDLDSEMYCCSVNRGDTSK